MSVLRRLLRLLSPGRPRDQRVLEGFVDSLLQTFENCRAGLTDEVLAGPEGPVATYFLDLYEKEAKRLPGVVELQCGHLSKHARLELLRKTDDLIRKVAIPGYVRLTHRFTRRERNDFYLTPDALHPVERVGWAVAGVALGSFVVWAPFIPLWSKEWVLVFALGGFVFPNVRKVLVMRRYASEVNGLVARVDDEIWRMDMGLMTDGETTDLDAGAADDRLEARLADVQAPAETASAGRPAVKQRGR